MSEALGDAAGVTLIDASDAFVFGYSKLDVMFGKADAARGAAPLHATSPSRACASCGRPSPRSTRRRGGSTTDDGVHEADILVVALGADYDLDATPGLAEAGTEFYSVAGAERVREVLPDLHPRPRGRRRVRRAVQVPARAERGGPPAARLPHRRGVRDDCEISLVMPFGTPVPPSPDTSAALLEAFAERGIEFVPGRRVASLDPGRSVAVLERRHGAAVRPLPRRAEAPRPDVVLESGMAEDGYIPVDSRTLETRFPASTRSATSRPSACRRRACSRKAPRASSQTTLVARLQGGEDPAGYDGRGSCYIEFGAGRVGRVDVDFFSGPKPTGTLQEPSAALVAEKQHFGSSRRARWFTPRPA